MDPSTPASRRNATLAERLLRAPMLVVAATIVLVDDAFRALFVPAIRALARLESVRRVEALVARLPPYATLALFGRDPCLAARDKLLAGNRPTCPAHAGHPGGRQALARELRRAGPEGDAGGAARRSTAARATDRPVRGDLFCFCAYVPI